MRRTVLTALAVALLALPAQAAGPKVDQRCAPAAGSAGASGGLYSQSLTPSSASTRRVDVVLWASEAQPVTLRLRIVGQRKVDDEHVVQVNMLAERQLMAKLPARRATVVSAVFDVPVLWDGGAPVNQFAIQLSLPVGDPSLVWLQCKPYAGGSAYQDSDVGAAAGRDTQKGVLTPVSQDLAFTTYAA